MELYAFGPFQSTSRNWPIKIVPAGYVDSLKKLVVFSDGGGGGDDDDDDLTNGPTTTTSTSSSNSSAAFEFKVTVSSSEAKRLADSLSMSVASASASSGTGRSSSSAAGAIDERINEDRKILEAYEIELVMREIVASSGQTCVIGVAVFNLAETIQSAHVWRRLIREEQLRADEQMAMGRLMANGGCGRTGVVMSGRAGSSVAAAANNAYERRESQRIRSIDLNAIGLYGNMDLWLPLRPRLKINDYGYKVLKVLDKHASDRRAIEFVKVKSLFRSSNNNSNNFY